jgi:hypothetical protein
VKSRSLDKDESRMGDLRNTQNILEAFAWKTWKQIEGEYKIDFSEMYKYRELYGSGSESCPVTSFDISCFEILGPFTRTLFVTPFILFTVGRDIDTELLPVHFCEKF